MILHLYRCECGNVGSAQDYITHDGYSACPRCGVRRPRLALEVRAP